MSKVIKPADTKLGYPYQSLEYGFGIAGPNKSYAGKLGDTLPWEKPEDSKVYSEEELKKIMDEAPDNA